MKLSATAAIAAITLAMAMLAFQYSGALAQTKPGLVGTLNQQKTELTLQLPKSPAKVTLNVSEVEEMIQMLAQNRAEMNPPRAMVGPAPGSKIDVATAGRWYVQPDETGIDIDVLHPGYGWVGIRMDRNSMEELNRTLSRSIRPVATRAKHPVKRD